MTRFRQILIMTLVAMFTFLSYGQAMAQKGVKGSLNYKKNRDFRSKKNGTSVRKKSYKQRDSFSGRRKSKGGGNGDAFVGRKKGKYGYTQNRYRDRKNYRYRTKGQQKRGKNMRRQKRQNPSDYSVNMRRYIKKRQRYKSQRTRKVMNPRG